MNAECGPTGPASTLIDAVFAELAAALARLAASGEETVIDLRGLPFGPAELEALSERLGTGEVACDLTVAGRSEVRETSWSGIWWVRHFGGDDQIAADELHVTRIPDILPSHPEDVALAAARMAEAVARTNEPTTTAADEEDMSRG